jgi:hypothetical protein
MKMMHRQTKLMPRLGYATELRATLIALFALAWISIFLMPAAAYGDMVLSDDGGAFDVRSAYLEPKDHKYHLNATLDIALSKSAEQALKDGVPVILQLEFQVIRPRKVFMDERVVTVTQKWRLQYHALSERYLVLNLNSNEQASYSNLQSAINSLSDVHLLPVIEESMIRAGTRYDASARISLIVEGGLPNALRAMMFWVDWKHVSEWYTWTVTP